MFLIHNIPHYSFSILPYYSTRFNYSLFLFYSFYGIIIPIQGGGMVISIRREELESLRKVGSGKFGTVYQKDDDVAYKIYHPTVSTYTGKAVDNPALKHPIGRLNLLRKKGAKLQYTDVLTDYIYIDGKFGGICIPYYDGVTLDKFMDQDFSVKIDVSKQLIRNGMELVRNHIYPIDYKLNNLMIENGNVRIIDLDDRFTHVRRIPSFIYKKGSSSALNDTIRTYFDEYHYTPFGEAVKSRIQREHWPYANNFDEIKSILKEKSIKHNYLVMDESSSLAEVCDYLSRDRYRVLFLFKTRIYDDDYFLNVIFQLKELGIDIYDFLSPYDLSKFFQNHSVDHVVYLQEKPKEKIKLH